MCSCHGDLPEKDVNAPVQEVANEHPRRQVEADPEQRPHATARRREDGLETVSGHGARRAGRGPQEPAVLYPTRPHGLVVGHGLRAAPRRRSRLAQTLLRCLLRRSASGAFAAIDSAGSETSTTRCISTQLAYIGRAIGYYGKVKSCDFASGLRPLAADF